MRPNGKKQNVVIAIARNHRGEVQSANIMDNSSERCLDSRNARYQETMPKIQVIGNVTFEAANPKFSILNIGWIKKNPSKSVMNATSGHTSNDNTKQRGAVEGQSQGARMRQRNPRVRAV